MPETDRDMHKPLLFIIVISGIFLTVAVLFFPVASNKGIMAIRFDLPWSGTDEHGISEKNGRAPEKMPLIAGPDIAKKSLAMLEAPYGINPDLVVTILNFKGIAIHRDTPLEETARRNGLSVDALYKMVREAGLSQKL